MFEVEFERVPVCDTYHIQLGVDAGRTNEVERIGKAEFVAASETRKATL